jgi:hypothetical protein
VGLFDNEELAVYCGPEPYLHGIAFDGQPDASAAEQAAAMVGAICARASNGVR